MRTLTFPLTLVSLLFLCCPLAAQGMKPIFLGSNFSTGWIPDHQTVLRGTLILNGDIGITPTWREWATYQGYAIIRVATYGDKYPSTWNLTAMRQSTNRRVQLEEVIIAMTNNSISELARRTGHPELNHAPIVSYGYSRFSSYAAFVLNDAYPDRHLAHLSGFGPTTDSPPNRTSGAWTSTPSLFLSTELEDTYGPRDSLDPAAMTDQPWRRFPGLLRGISMTRGNRHDPFNAHELGAVFFDQVIQARVPSDWDPRSGPATLTTITESDGWLGDNSVFLNIERELTADHELVPTITPFADYSGDAGAMSWLPNEATAWVWRGFSMGRPLATVISPSHPGLPGQVHWKGGKGQMAREVLHLEHNLRADTSFRVTGRCEADDIRQLDVFANQHHLGTITEFSGGELATGSTMGASGSCDVSLPAGVYGLMLRYTRNSGRVGWSRPALITVFRPEH